jgi:acetolactate synthase-1/2/3 large subunit
MTGAQSLVRSLETLGVDVVFGIPGGAILPLYDPLMDSTKVRHILVRHEQGAGHAAEGYAAATGRVGVCMATSGPGATNLVTPLADAYMDSVPIVAITGQVPSASIGTDAFQEADIRGITMPITKHNFLVRDGNDIPRVMAEAFHIASSGRPGPVLVDIPKDVLQGQCTFSWPPRIELPGYKPIQQMVYCDFYPSGDTQYDELRDAMDRLSLNDSSFSFEPESNDASSSRSKAYRPA